MEMEGNIVLKNEKLYTFDILRKSLAISARNINFFFFTILTSLPLFCFLAYYQPSLQKVQVAISEILTQPNFFSYFFDEFIYDSSLEVYFDEIIDDSPRAYVATSKLENGFPDDLIQPALLYLVPVRLLELGTALAITDLASKIYKEGRQMTLKEMILNRPFDKTRLKAASITCVYFLVFSTCSDILGIMWSAGSYYFAFRYFMHRVLFALWCFVVCVALLTMYLAWNAVWNMSIVISILEGIHGTKAIGLAVYLSFGYEWRGFLFMLIFFAWGVSLRLPCLYFGCKGIGNAMFVAQICFSCFGNVLKWVVFIIYFYDCKNRVLERRLMKKAEKTGSGDQAC